MKTALLTIAALLSAGCIDTAEAAKLTDLVTYEKSPEEIELIALFSARDGGKQGLSYTLADAAALEEIAAEGVIVLIPAV